jgi:hypothetical protein
MRSRSKPYAALLVLAVFFVPLFLHLYLSTPGPQAIALEKELQGYIDKSFETVAMRYGAPDDDYYPTLHGTPYMGWIYKRRDGQVRLMGPLSTSTVEYVFAEPLHH